MEDWVFNAQGMQVSKLIPRSIIDKALKICTSDSYEGVS